MDQFWGDRYGKLKDPFGHNWSIATHTKDLSMDEMKHGMDEAMAKMKPECRRPRRSLMRPMLTEGQPPRLPSSPARGTQSQGRSSVAANPD